MRAPSPPSPDEERWVSSYVEPNGSASNAQRTSARRLIVLAYILAISLPPLGFILGLAVILRSTTSSRHGVTIIVISVLAALVWILILTSGTLSSTDTAY